MDYLTLYNTAAEAEAAVMAQANLQELQGVLAEAAAVHLEEMVVKEEVREVLGLI